MLISLQETIKRIEGGQLLHIAADERLLSQLPKGKWIGGTTPYFISENGGVTTADKLFVNEFPFASDYKIAAYDESSIHSVAADAYDNGFTLFVLPFGSRVLEAFAKDAPEIDGIFMKNIAGWVSGFNLGESGASARTFNGQTGASSSDSAVALHVALPASKLASIGIINIFEPDETGPVIEFGESSFDVLKCRIDGKEEFFADYLARKGIDTKLPLVADYSGLAVNISIKQIVGKTVKLYAPVFAGMKYRFAKPVGDYAAAFEAQIRDSIKATPVFSCNCILNYLYGQLEGKSTAPFAGPVTFGEVAYQLVNQTLVFVSVQ